MSSDVEIDVILSVRVIRKPKRVRQCYECGRDIEGVTIRYYGVPDVGDKPYCLYVHPGCIDPGHARGDGRITAAVNTAMNLSWDKLRHTLFVFDDTDATPESTYEPHPSND